MKGEREGAGRAALYWCLQTVGWGGYFSLAAIQMYAMSKRVVIFLVWLLIMLGHVAGSHAIRFILKRNGWRFQPFSKLAGRLFLTIALLAIAVDLCVSPVAVIAGISTADEQESLYWFYVAATFVLLTLWSLSYIAFVRYREKEARAMHLQASLREAELRVLRSQVNPHFLFNCLNNLRSLVAEDSEKARDMLLGLSEMLRYSLEAGRKERVDVDQELHIVQRYLELEKLHFEARLTWKIEADSDARRGLIPPMFIQQLVENAIKHGISKQPSGGEILICAGVRGSGLEVKVENTGRLVEPSVHGFGIANARERLKLLCGANSVLHLENVDGGRVAAIAEIPNAA